MQNPTSFKFLKYYPAATSDGDPITHVNNFYKVGANSNLGDKMDFKIDHNISDRQRLTSRYSVDWGHSDPVNLWGNISGNVDQSSHRTQNYMIDYTRTHNPTTVMTIRASVLRNRANTVPISTGSMPSDPSTLGLSPMFQALGVNQFPNISATSYRTLGAGGWALIQQGEDVGLINGSVTKSVAAHIIKAGAEFRLYHENYFQPGYSRRTPQFQPEHDGRGSDHLQFEPGQWHRHDVAGLGQQRQHRHRLSDSYLLPLLRNVCAG